MNLKINEIVTRFKVEFFFTLACLIIAMLGNGSPESILLLLMYISGNILLIINSVNIWIKKKNTKHRFI